jgi:hypothetical protein
VGADWIVARGLPAVAVWVRIAANDAVEAEILTCLTRIAKAGAILVADLAISAIVAIAALGADTRFVGRTLAIGWFDAELLLRRLAGPRTVTVDEALAADIDGGVAEGLVRRAVRVGPALAAGARLTVRTAGGRNAVRPRRRTVEVRGAFETLIVEAANAGRRGEIAVAIDAAEDALFPAPLAKTDIGDAVAVILAPLPYRARPEAGVAPHASAAAVNVGFAEVLDAVLAVVKALTIAAGLVITAAVLATTNGVAESTFLFLLVLLSLLAALLLGENAPVLGRVEGGQYRTGHASEDDPS